MREAIGGISIFQIVIVLILLFTGIMCLTINHSKAFGVKDEIITIIENETLGGNASTDQPNYGISDTMLQKIVAQLDKAGYHTEGYCPTDKTYAGYDRNGVLVNRGKKASFCLRANKVDDEFEQDAKNVCKTGVCQTTENEFPPMVYYDVVLFFQLDIPLINYLFNFNLKGTTKIMFGSSVSSSTTITERSTS